MWPAARPGILGLMDVRSFRYIGVLQDHMRTFAEVIPLLR
jgi:hypothetical protein